MICQSKFKIKIHIRQNKQFDDQMSIMAEKVAIMDECLQNDDSELEGGWSNILSASDAHPSVDLMSQLNHGPFTLFQTGVLEKIL